MDAAAAVAEALRTVRWDDPPDRRVEAHLHDGRRLMDVDAVVLDPRHRGTAVEIAAGPLHVPGEWLQGFVLPADRPPTRDGYRGVDAVRVRPERRGASTADQRR